MYMSLFSTVGGASGKIPKVGWEVPLSAGMFSLTVGPPMRCFTGVTTAGSIQGIAVLNTPLFRPPVKNASKWLALDGRVLAVEIEGSVLGHGHVKMKLTLKNCAGGVLGADDESIEIQLPRVEGLVIGKSSFQTTLCLVDPREELWQELKKAWEKKGRDESPISDKELRLRPTPPLRT
jgi:hypothetical protein